MSRLISVGLRQNGTLSLLIFKALLYHMTLATPLLLSPWGRTPLLSVEISLGIKNIKIDSLRKPVILAIHALKFSDERA